MAGRLGWAGVLAGLAALVAVGVACTPDPAASPAGGTAPGRWRTEPLTVEEVRGRPALGLDVRAQPVLDPADFDVARLDVPCVGPVDLPSGTDGVVRAFRASFTLTVETTAVVPGAVEVVAAVERQLGTGCPPGPPVYEVVTLPELGDARIGWIDRRPVPGRPERVRLVALAAAADRLGLVAVVADRPIGAAELAALADLAFRPSS